MYKVLYKFQITNTNKCCIDVEGNTQLLKNGTKLKDENGNIFIIESIGMIEYKNIEHHKRNATLVLNEKKENVGDFLIIVE